MQDLTIKDTHKKIHIKDPPPAAGKIRHSLEQEQDGGPPHDGAGRRLAVWIVGGFDAIVIGMVLGDRGN